MTSTRSTAKPFHVVIAGGGVAGLEALLALRALGTDHFDVTLIAPDAEFVYRPMTVREPFAYAPAQRAVIADIAADASADLLVDSFASVNPTERIVHTNAERHLHYDALILALGARPEPRYAHALTIDDHALDAQLHGLIQDVEGGYVHRLAFVIPERVAWPLPIYELALMTAWRAYDMSADLEVTVVTSEAAPLAIFGAGASSGLSKILAEHGVNIITSAHCEVPDGRHVMVNPGDHRMEVDRVVALPELHGPAVHGLPQGEHGFIPVDTHCQVRGVKRVYAAGDAIDSPIKYGGLSAQQADTAVDAIAALSGLPVESAPSPPLVHGILLTGAAPRYLTAQAVQGHGFRSEFTDAPTWTPATKISAKFLAPYLEGDRVAVAR